MAAFLPMTRWPPVAGTLACQDVAMY